MYTISSWLSQITLDLASCLIPPNKNTDLQIYGGGAGSLWAGPHIRVTKSNHLEVGCGPQMILMCSQG